MQNIIEHIRQIIQQHAFVEVIWLYGSQATGKQSVNSDYDLALAMQVDTDNRKAKLEELRYQLNTELEVPISIVDINKVPTPLALNIINDGNIVFCSNVLRLRTEEQRVWSLWEAYQYEYERIRQSL